MLYTYGLAILKHIHALWLQISLLIIEKSKFIQNMKVDYNSIPKNGVYLVTKNV